MQKTGRKREELGLSFDKVIKTEKSQERDRLSDTTQSASLLNMPDRQNLMSTHPYENVYTINPKTGRKIKKIA